MQEWASIANPFNSAKILYYPEHLKGCATYNYLPPIDVAIDPTNKCQENCIWCNAYDVRNELASELPEDHLVKMGKFLGDWGVKGNCIAGGGEPLLAKGFCALLESCHTNNVSNSVITNGVAMTDEIIKMMASTCAWVGISVDAGTEKTYTKVKGIKNENYFKKVLENIKKLRKQIDNTYSRTTIGFKFLIHPYNQGEIYAAAAIAKAYGAHDFQARPVGWENITVTKNANPLKYDHAAIDRELKKAFMLGDKNFHVYGIRHKFHSNFSAKKNFSRCWTIPTHPTFAADGNVYLCLDKRGKKDEILCTHYPDLENVLKSWNTEHHHNMMKTIDVSKCPRCTHHGYNEIVEHGIISDEMYLRHI